jgi:uncharacterized membrane protein SpoIIM required for sporulation
MKETRFIAQNKEKWLESETLLTSPVKDPEKLSNLFTQVVDDLSFSRTYYKNRSVRVYLNKIAREYFSIIYNLRKEKKNHFKLFWLDELPQIILYCKKQLLISFIVFVLAACIGVFSSYKDPQFATTILGESYVSMTKENIEKGDPMAVYKKGHQVDMFLGITLNNLMVAFRTYVFGIFLAIGSLAILLYNGIMVGCFQFFFIERGLLAESALTIWLHGTLEISSIILAGGAGLTLGSGLVFPVHTHDCNPFRSPPCVHSNSCWVYLLFLYWRPSSKVFSHAIRKCPMPYDSFLYYYQHFLSLAIL